MGPSSEHGGQPSSLTRNNSVAHGVDLLVDGVQAPDGQPIFDLVPPYTEVEQL
jgi:hypothetical protein